MLFTIPDYYKEFSCIADQCEDTCCAGWQIVVDPKSLKKYKSVRGAYRKTLMKNVNFFAKIFRQDKEKRCAFLNEDNLCEMYIHLGKDSLCKTCRLYPRHVEEFEGVREISLSVSCPEVARILMNRIEPVTFRTKETEREESYEDFDDFLYSMLLDAREDMIKILQNRELPLMVREGLIYGIGRDIQRKVNHQELFDCYQVLDKYKKKSAMQFVKDRIRANRCNVEGTYVFYKEMFRRIRSLELLKEDWFLLCEEVEQRLYVSRDGVSYGTLTDEFNEWMKAEYPQWEIQKEQLLVYFIFTYFCGAVYDGEILKKVQMAVISVDILEEILKARWLRNEKYLDTEDVIEVVYRYSREVEHSEGNLKKIEKLMPITHVRFC